MASGGTGEAGVKQSCTRSISTLHPWLPRISDFPGPSLDSDRTSHSPADSLLCASLQLSDAHGDAGLCRWSGGEEETEGTGSRDGSEMPVLVLARPQPCRPPPSPTNVTLQLVPQLQDGANKGKKNPPEQLPSWDTLPSPRRMPGAGPRTVGRSLPITQLIPPYLKRARSYFTPRSHRGPELCVIPRLLCHPR